jgi:hypothetical protein
MKYKITTLSAITYASTALECKKSNISEQPSRNNNNSTLFKPKYIKAK